MELTYLVFVQLPALVLTYLVFVQLPALVLTYLVFVQLPALVLTYLGQAAYLIKHPENISNAFYANVPGRPVSAPCPLEIHPFEILRPK